MITALPVQATPPITGSAMFWVMAAVIAGQAVANYKMAGALHRAHKTLPRREASAGAEDGALRNGGGLSPAAPGSAPEPKRKKRSKVTPVILAGSGGVVAFMVAMGHHPSSPAPAPQQPAPRVITHTAPVLGTGGVIVVIVALVLVAGVAMAMIRKRAEA